MGTARAPVVGAGRAPAWIARVRMPQSRSSGWLMDGKLQSGGMSILPGPLVEPDWLAGHLAHVVGLVGAPLAGVVVLGAPAWLAPPAREGKPYDVRSGRADWEESHIPGSAFADV